jgi:hypothetical protein
MTTQSGKVKATTILTRLPSLSLAGVVSPDSPRPWSRRRMRGTVGV